MRSLLTTVLRRLPAAKAFQQALGINYPLVASDNLAERAADLQVNW
jgi:hypothetical protein